MFISLASENTDWLTLVCDPRLCEVTIPTRVLPHRDAASSVASCYVAGECWIFGNSGCSTAAFALVGLSPSVATTFCFVWFVSCILLESLETSCISLLGIGELLFVSILCMHTGREPSCRQRWRTTIRGMAPSWSAAAPPTRRRHTRRTAKRSATDGGSWKSGVGRLPDGASATTAPTTSTTSSSHRRWANDWTCNQILVLVLVLSQQTATWRKFCYAAGELSGASNH